MTLRNEVVLNQNYNMKATTTEEVAKLLAGDYKVLYASINEATMNDMQRLSVGIKDFEIHVKGNKRNTYYVDFTSFRASNDSSFARLDDITYFNTVLNENEVTMSDKRLESQQLSVLSKARVSTYKIGEDTFKIVGLTVRGNPSITINLLISDNKQKLFMFTTYFTQLKEISLETTKMILQSIIYNVFPLYMVHLETPYKLSVDMRWLNAQVPIYARLYQGTRLALTFGTQGIDMYANFSEYKDLGISCELSYTIGKYDTSVLEYKDPEQLRLQLVLINPIDDLQVKNGERN